MADPSNVQLIFFAAGGALAVKLLDLAELQNVEKERRPDLKDIFYWIPWIIFPLIAAFVAYAYIVSDVKLNPILAINVGASAPLLLKSFANVVPKDIHNK